MDLHDDYSARRVSLVTNLIGVRVGFNLRVKGTDWIVNKVGSG